MNINLHLHTYTYGCIVHLTTVYVYSSVRISFSDYPGYHPGEQNNETRHNTIHDGVLPKYNIQSFVFVKFESSGLVKS